MRRLAAAVLVLVLSVVFAAISHAGETYYARCNLKIAKGKYISWINWQHAPEFIPVNTKLEIVVKGAEAIVTRQDNGKSYKMDYGTEGEAYLGKFLSRNAVDLSIFPEDVQASIKASTISLGMTKEQVYISMGPPSLLMHTNTTGNTYEQILTSNQWSYTSRRWGNYIKIVFDAKSGKVIGKEGI